MASESLTAEVITAPADATSRSKPLTGAAVASVAMAVPETVVPSAAVAERLGVSGDWIESRTGIRERRIAGPGETLTDLATLAGERALAAAGVDAAELDLVVVATLTADRRLPNAAPLVAARLGATGAGAFDLGAACTGFVAALNLAVGQIESGRARMVLVIGAETLSRVTDRDDKRTAGLFADGAGAAVVCSSGSSRIGPSVWGADGSESELITLTGDDGLIRMNGHDTFRHAVARLIEATRDALATADLDVSEIDLFVFHQANGRILSAVAEALELAPEKVADYVGAFGNTSTASIPIALAQADADGRLRPGSRVLLAAFGSGLTWSAITIEWGGWR